MTDFAVCIILLVLALVGSVVIVNVLDRSGRAFWRIVLFAGMPLAGIRIAILWYVVYLNASGRGSYDNIVFAFFFAPEGFFLRHRITGTNWDPVLGSAALAFGSYLWTVLLVRVIKDIRRYPK